MRMRAQDSLLLLAFLLILTSHLSYLITMATIAQISRPRIENDPNTVATVTTILRSESSSCLKNIQEKTSQLTSEDVFEEAAWPSSSPTRC